MTTRTRTSTTRIQKWKDGKPVFVASELIYTFDELLRKWIKRDGKTWLETPEQNGWSKSVELLGLIKREMQNTYQRNPKPAFYIQKFIVKIPNLKSNKFIYLRKFNGQIYMRDFAKDFTVECELSNDFMHKVGKPQRISVKRASKMLKNRECYPLLLHEVGSGFQYEIP